MEKKEFTVLGMSCASCVRAVERSVKKLEGIECVNVNLTTEKLVVEYDENKVTVDLIKKAVVTAGYELVLEESRKAIKEVIIPISGMTCASCVRAVERAVKKLNGVNEVNVNLATEKANIKYNPEFVKLQMIKDAINNAGYQALDIEENNFNEDKLHQEKVLRIQHLKLIWALIFTVPLFYIAMGHMIGMPLPRIINPELYPLNYALSQLILVIPIMIIGYKFYTNGFQRLIHLAPNMDSLVAIGTSSAFVYSIYSLIKIINGHEHFTHYLYFETTGVIITLILLGKYLENTSKGKTTEAIKKLLGLKPKNATLIIEGKEVIVPIDEVAVNDLIIVKPGEKIPVDGLVVDGYSFVDESMLTGESIPIEKSIGTKVYTASINKNGTLIIKATKVGEDTVLSQIIKLVEEAQSTKAPIAKLADIISGYFVPIVILLAFLSGIFWLIGGESIVFALQIFVSVLVIACPCALGLATPTAIMVGTGKGAELGILIKSGEALEVTHQINCVVFDKTGTITEGKPIVTDIIVSNEIDMKELLRIAAIGEKGSEHPLGEAIVNKAQIEGLELPKWETFEALPGQGIKYTFDNKVILLGNEKLMNNNNVEITFLKEAQTLANAGKTPMFMAIDGKMQGIIAVSDTVKVSSNKAISKLKQMGIEIAMITGDNEKTAQAIAKEVGVTKVLAEVLPDEKANEIKKLQKDGYKVAMVGDGINDAIALAQADIGMAIGSGTDVAMESADIVLMRNDLIDVAIAIELSKATIRNIKQNLFWAFGYNTLGIPIAAGVLHLFGGPLLNPMLAALAMAFSSVSVVTNALRLKRFKIKK